jgi:hypothetical protein
LAPSREAMETMSLCPRQRLLQQRCTGRQRRQSSKPRERIRCACEGSNFGARVQRKSRIESFPHRFHLAFARSDVVSVHRPSTPAFSSSSPIIMLRCRAPLLGRATKSTYGTSSKSKGASSSLHAACGFVSSLHSGRSPAMEPSRCSSCSTRPSEGSCGPLPQLTTYCVIY